MSFDTVAKGIIGRAIATAVCVDDKFPEPYSEDAGDASTPRDLYYAFRAEQCVLDVYRYHEWDRWQSDGPRVLADKDLLILDWELADAGVKYRDALAILAEAVAAGSIPFVYIYTNATDLDQVAFAIRAHFCAPLIAVAQSVKERIEGFIEKELQLDVDDALEELGREFFDLALYPADEENTRKRIRAFLAASPGAGSRNEKHLYKLLLGAAGTAMDPPANVANHLAIEAAISYALRPYEEPSGCEVVFDCVESVRAGAGDSERYTFLIGHTLVRVVQRDTVPAHEVPADLSRTIRGASRDRFLRLLSLEMRTFLRKGALQIANGLDRVDELAFFHHAKKIKSPAAFEEFVKELWKDQLGAFVMVQTPELLAEIDAYKVDEQIEEQLASTFVGGQETLKPLAKLNFYYSNLHVPRAPEERIRFGDIFRVLLPGEDGPGPSATDNYVLCVTAHCDCLRPEKVHHTFLFVFGHKVDLETGLKDGDEGHHSYVKIGDEIVCIEWTAKPFTIHIPEDRNHISEIGGCEIRGVKRVLRHVSYQKESYTQRIANHAFAQAMRVGVDYAQYPHKDEGAAA